MMTSDISSECVNILPPSEQLCYIPCNLCSIMLAVSVPCSSLFDIVTVRCGHCSNLWSVNMAGAMQSLYCQDRQGARHLASPNYKFDMGLSSNCNKISMPPLTNNKTGRINDEQPPPKKQRVPSAYNQFIKEEIQRVKANNPAIAHREAFSTAAKNWANYPRVRYEG